MNIDIAGRTPTAAEVAEFLQDHDPAKRDKLIESLLSSSEYADYFATKWNSVLRNKRRKRRLCAWHVRLPRVDS